MTRNVLNLVVILTFATVSPAWADDAKAVEAAVPSDTETKEAMDAKIAASGATYESQVSAIVRDCGVDPSKEKQLRALLQSWDEVTKAVAATANKTNPDLTEKLQVLDKELSAAKYSNNADLVEDLSKQRATLEDLMAGWDPSIRKQFEDVDTKYRSALRDVVPADKVDRLDDILDAAQDAQLNRPRRGPVRSPRALKAIVDRLGDLTPDQRRNVDGVFQQFRDSQRATRHSQDNSVIEKKLYDDVFAVLTDGQKTKVEQQLAGRATVAAPKAPATPGGAAPAPAARPEPADSNNSATGTAAPAASAGEKP